ncbi:MAG: NUDIX hydrolase [Marinilabiliales bacterium]|nr:MAG: NUDIX hydrolase [Marinilabiliales bacterium]
MGRLGVLKKMLPGLVPLFVFILADEIWGTQIGIIVAVVVGNIQLLVTYLREKRLDKFILFDTLLIVALGLISVVLNNDIFFKLKPGLIGILICAFLGFSIFSHTNIMLKMSQRYMKGIQLNEQQVKQFNRSLRFLFFIFLVHTALVFYSSFYMSKEAWAFISGGLFYIIFGVYFIYEFLRVRLGNKKILQEEILPIVDEKGTIIGRAPRERLHNGSKHLHPVVHLHIVNNKKQIYLQKRPDSKKVQPGKWDTAVGGHVELNEKIDDALLREAKEELNLESFDFKPLMVYLWESDIEKELVYSFVSVYNSIISYNKEEISDGRFWSIQSINQQLGKGVFTPNFEKEFIYVKKYLTKG